MITPWVEQEGVTKPSPDFPFKLNHSIILHSYKLIEFVLHRLCNTDVKKKKERKICILLGKWSTNV